MLSVQATEQGSVTAAEFPPLLSDVVPRPISAHHSPLLIEEPSDSHRRHKSSIGKEIEAGFLYEIDHVHLPPRTPVQLRSIRVAMVCEKREANVAVRYPSTESLRAFFNYSTRETHPTLDKKFVMGTALAARVLVRVVPTKVFSEQKNLESFWLISSAGCENKVKYLGRHTATDGNDGNGQNSSSSFVIGVEESHVELGDLHREGSDVDQLNAIGNGGDKNNEKDEGDEEEENEEDEDEGREEEEEEEEEKGKGEPEEKKIKKNDKSLKRKIYSFRNKSVKKPKKEKVVVKRKQKQKKPTTFKKNKGKSRFKEASVLRDPKDRWSAERYKTAEENLLRVMIAKGATAKNPILRPQLRAEARKRIGDTGLLDHLLKHMAGKLAPNGEERFRRRHNPDGAMEYWLESAELVNIRREAGVTDPYWVPPPGWKPGDPPTQDAICAREFKLLKDDIFKIKRDVELMATKIELEEEIGRLRRELDESRKELNQGISIASSQSDHSQKLGQQIDTSLMTFPKSDFAHEPFSVENCKKQLMTISGLLKKIEEKMENPTPNLEERATTKDSSLMLPTETHTKSKQGEVQALMTTKEEPSKPCKDDFAQTEASTKAATARAEEKAAKIQRLKSGFRLCKPQGTFLWPDMVKDNNKKSNSSSGIIMSPQVVVQVEVATPTSVSTASSAAPPQLPYHHHHYHHHHHHHPTSLVVKPLAEKRAVTVSTVSKVQDDKGTPNSHSF